MLQAPSLESEFDVALSVAGLNTSTARFDPALLRLFGETAYSTPLFSSVYENPWRLPFYSDAIRSEFAAASLSDSLNSSLRMLGKGTRRTLLGDPLQPSLDKVGVPNDLADTLNTMKSAGLFKADAPSLVGVPSDVQKAASLILRTYLATVGSRRLAVRKLGQVEPVYTYLLTGANQDLTGESAARLRQIEEDFDVTAMGVAAHDIARAAETAADFVAKIDPTLKYSFELDTVWGTILLKGGGADRYAEKPALLIIDTSGNDVYVNQPRNANASNWSSVVIDTAGNDKYISDAALENGDVASFGARKTGGAAPGSAGALLGVSVLVDLAGNDVYRSHRPGQGSGRFGFGLQLDRDGDDLYDAYRDSQGFGSFGGGLLIDQAGTDRYQVFTQGQGCGLTLGFGGLFDRMGDDKYVANNSVIDFASPQDAKQNVSMSQGAATGRRADYSDGNNLAGGIGLLLDVNGNDQYECGVFGQGVGYWKGVGMLWDISGTDIYQGQWYVQGASAHYAIGYLLDVDGNDVYSAALNMAQGAGHDFSIGALIDRNGNDRYQAPNLSLGAGNANGIGFFVDGAGDDVYDTRGLTLGRGAEAQKGGFRSRALTLGVFMDLNGTDRYPESFANAGNARRLVNWTEKLERVNESQLGVFFDR
jgi:hypothetical protein